MSDIIEFGFDDGKVIRQSGLDRFTQSRSGEKSRISIIAFKKFHDVLLAKTQREKGEPLSDAEKADLIAKIDKNLAEKIEKKVEDLTETDRLDIKSPRFSFAFTHFGDGVGIIRCLGKYEGTNLVKGDVCCEKYGDADQQVGTVLMTYPVTDNLSVDVELLKQRKYTNFHVWRMNAKKFARVEGAYVGAREDDRFVIDLKVTLEGDPKYQKQQIEYASSAYWARDDTDKEVREWILERGMKLYKHVSDNLGFPITKEKLLERIGGGGDDASSSDDASPKLQSGYSTLLD